MPDILDDKYEIKKEIASGAMGEVYLAHHNKLHRDVAIKVPHKRFSADPAFVERFLREARAMARMDHQNIISVFDVLVIDDTPYIVMEYFPAPNLKDRIMRSGKFSIADTISIAAQVANGLNYAHGMGIIHRDIKPANIMADNNGIAKLADFGIAAAAGEAGLTATGDVIGTPQYMSPEQARGHALDYKTDLYSLGIVLYQMITQKTPFDDISTVAMIGKLAYEESELELTFPSDTPIEFAELIREMVAKNPDNRPISTEIVHQKLYNLLSSEVRQNLPTIATLEADNDLTVLSASTPTKQASNSQEVPTIVRPEETKAQSKSPMIAIVATLVISTVAAAGFFIFQKTESDRVNTPVAQPEVQKETVEQLRQEALALAKKREDELLKEKVRQLKEEADELARQKQREAERELQRKAELESDLKETLSELANAKTVAFRAQTAAGNEFVRKWAKSKFEEANSLLTLADKLDAQVQSLVSRDLPEQAMVTAGEAVIEYANASKGFENATKESEFTKELSSHLNIELNNVEILLVQSEKAKVRADKLNAAQVSSRIYDNANDLFQSSIELHRKGKESVNHIDLESAIEQIHGAESQARMALVDFVTAEAIALNALEVARSKPATKDDIDTVSQVLQKLERSFETRNLKALDNLTTDSSDKIEFFSQLFSIYENIEVTINDFAVTSRKATANVTIDKLIKKNGDVTLPANSWKITKLVIDKTNIGWDKIRMP